MWRKRALEYINSAIHSVIKEYSDMSCWRLLGRYLWTLTVIKCSNCNSSNVWINVILWGVSGNVILIFNTQLKRNYTNVNGELIFPKINKIDKHNPALVLKEYIYIYIYKLFFKNIFIFYFMTMYVIVWRSCMTLRIRKSVSMKMKYLRVQ
jgi:hypothetical protein